MKIKMQFIILHKELFIEHEKQLILRPELKYREHILWTAMEIVMHARKRIGYKKSTAACDIFRTLFFLYKKIMQDGTQIFFQCPPIPEFTILQQREFHLRYD